MHRMLGIKSSNRLDSRCLISKIKDRCREKLEQISNSSSKDKGVSILLCQVSNSSNKDQEVSILLYQVSNSNSKEQEALILMYQVKNKSNKDMVA